MADLCISEFSQTYMATVEVFKTNVCTRPAARQLAAILKRAMPGCRFTFDLEDSDRILRVEYGTQGFEVSAVICLLKRFRYRCEQLPD